MCLAVPGKIVSVNETDPLFRLGVVDFGGVTTLADQLADQVLALNRI